MTMDLIKSSDRFLNYLSRLVGAIVIISASVMMYINNIFSCNQYYTTQALPDDIGGMSMTYEYCMDMNLPPFIKGGALLIYGLLILILQLKLSGNSWARLTSRIMALLVILIMMISITFIGSS